MDFKTLFQKLDNFETKIEARFDKVEERSEDKFDQIDQKMEKWRESHDKKSDELNLKLTLVQASVEGLKFEKKTITWIVGVAIALSGGGNIMSLAEKVSKASDSVEEPAKKVVKQRPVVERSEGSDGAGGTSDQEED